MQKWDYLILRCDYDDKRDLWFWHDNGIDLVKARAVDRLKKLGEEGWELVSVEGESTVYGQGWAGFTTMTYYYLKRPI